ncbi:MAG: lipid-A-disaccharide synthase [Fimbriimonadaceae bacterium]|jgi:lipid-A-disaccharide synthase|nr:lipid-A-disaccharide synthase [Fimbriimonadaceae bacterium]
MRVFLSSGEASGDAYAAALAREFRVLVKDWATYEGIGGTASAQGGIKLWADSSTWGSIGIAQAIKVAPRAYKGLKIATRALATGEPGLFIPIDFGYFNIRLARRARSLGWRVLYFMPPGSWRKDVQGHDLPEIADEIVTPFSWSAEMLSEMGAKAHWFGHPLKQLIRESGVARQPRHDNRIAVLPGSRGHEIQLNLPVIAGALAQINQAGLVAEFAVAPTINAESLARGWRRLAPHRVDDIFVVGDNYGVLRRARAAVVCSGTATLEAALCECPMVVVYRVSAGMALQARIAGFQQPFIALPNILLDRHAVPELVHKAATPAALATMLYDVMQEGPERRGQLTAFEEINSLTGPHDAITKTARVALDLIRRAPEAIIRIGDEEIEVRPEA